MYTLLLQWLRKKLELDEPIKVCEACRVLELENAKLWNFVNELQTPKLIESEVKEPRDIKPILPRRQNWNTERMRLERESFNKENERLKEKALKAAGKPNARGETQQNETATSITAPSNNSTLGAVKSIEELENELSVDLPPLDDNQKVS